VIEDGGPRLCLALIFLASFIVPRHKRGEWRAEWNAEVHYEWNRLVQRRRLNVLTYVALLARTGGAFIHGVWLRHREWRLEMLIQDLLYGLRTLIRKPAFTLVAITVLALGIGANTAIFSVVYSVLLRPLPFKDPGRLVMLFSHNTRQDVSYSTLSADDLSDFQKQNDVFEGLAAVTGKWAFSINLTGEAEQIFGSWVSANFFQVLGQPPQIGRAFSAQEDLPSGNHVTILSFEMWQRRFGGSPDMLGKTLMIGGTPYQVVGVMARGFRFLEDAELWLPAGQNPVGQRGRNVRYINAIARLKPGVSLEQADAAMKTIAARLENQYADTNTGFTTDLRFLLDHVTSQARRTLYMLLAAVGFVLLIACANIANLLLVRSVDRQREVAVRAALGADRGRLVKQFLTESMLLSVLGSALGLLLARWGIRLLVSMSPNIPRLDEIRIDLWVLAFTLSLSLATGMIFGLVPAIQATHADFQEKLKESGRGGSSGAPRRRLRSALVVSEVALALVLLISSGLLIRSFVRLINVDPGYRTENMVVVNTLVPPTKYPQPQQRLDLYYSLEEKLKSLPGIINAGAVSRFPLSGVTGSNNITSFFTIEGHTVATGERPEIDYRIASTDYFETMGIPLIRGRKFTRQDATQVALINEAAAGKFWPDSDPVGKRVNFGNPAQTPWVTIIGIVGNVRHLGLEVEPRPEVYRPYPNNPLTAPAIAVRTALNPRDMTALIRSELHLVEKEMPITIATIDQLIDLSVAQRRFSMTLLGIFAVLAMVLAVVGIYGVMSYVVSQRTAEIGLRIALGAERSHVVKMVVYEGLSLTAAGVVLGLALSMAATRMLAGLLFGVTSTDPLTYVAVSFVLAAVAVMACCIPALRASRVDPLVALRYE
jgi:putative ABC transport system permease protein